MSKGDIMLDPGNRTQYSGHPYIFGIDPAWQSATNKISFLNTYKMKISLIFGLIHMVFGVFVSLKNHIHFKHTAEIFFEFIPQLTFLVSIFCYLLFLIFFKWVFYGADNYIHHNTHSEHCAPNLLITFINMMLFKKADRDDKLHAICKGYEIFMYPGQDLVQKLLVVLGVLMVPVMFFGKPIYTVVGRLRRRRLYINIESDGEQLISIQTGDAGSDNEPEPGFGDIMINNAIHTIEFVLGCVSHTASYLRLWALSLAHSQLSEVLWNMVMRNAFSNSYSGAVMMYFIFAAWVFMTLAILVLMEGLSAFLHTLRLHWVEFMSKFYKGQGVAFVPFSFQVFVRDAAIADKEIIKNL